MPTQEIRIEPQPGPQFDFLSSKADIAIYGGAAGGGKSYGLLMEPLRHYNNPHFGAVIFRRSTPEIRNEGGLWDESKTIYTQLKGRPREQALEWEFPNGFRIKFAHLEHEKTVHHWHGSQIPLIEFDELTTFTEYQFWYMLSRNRSTSGVPGYIRASCNPNPDSFVRKLIDWWIGPDGYPIRSRSGVLRYFIRIENTLYWGDSPEEIRKKYGHGPEIMPKSITFIPSKLTDNQVLMAKDPNYRANLMALPKVDRERLLEGNWNIRRSAGAFFRREWFPIVDAIPGGWTRVTRYWDRAATEPSAENPNPDWTRGLKLYAYPDGTFCVGDLKSARSTPGRVDSLIKTVASHDGKSVRIKSQQDPGSAGVKEAEEFIKMLAGFNVASEVETKNKATRAQPVSSQAEHGNVKVLRAEWNEEFFSELVNFSEDPNEYDHDDIVDCLSGAFNDLTEGPTAFAASSLNKLKGALGG